MEVKATTLAAGPLDPRKVGFPTKKAMTMSGHAGAVLTVRLTRDGKYCMSGGKDRCINLWNPATGLRVKEYKDVHGKEVRDVAVVADNSKFASCSGDRRVYFWDVPSGKSLRRFYGHEGSVNALSFNTDCTVLASGSYDKTVRFWDLRSNMRDPIQTLSQCQDSVSSLCIVDHEVVVASVDNHVRTFDLRMGQVVSDYLGASVTSVSISNDKKCFLASCMENAARLMDRTTGEMLNEYCGHRHENYSLQSCFSNDDAFVLSGSEDGLVYIWDLVEAKVVHTLSGHSRSVLTLAYSPSETMLVSGSSDGSILTWI